VLDTMLAALRAARLEDHAVMISGETVSLSVMLAIGRRPNPRASGLEGVGLP